MTVSEIGDNKIKITLTDTEVLCCFGNYEKLFTMSYTIKYAFNSLVRDIINQHRRHIGKGKVIVQIKAEKNLGCEIMLTCIKQRRSLTYTEYIFEFDDTESMTMAILYLYGKKSTAKLLSSLYKMPESYRLVINCRSKKESLFVLSEFGRNISANKCQALLTREQGKPLILNNAIEKYGRIFSKET